jgi:uncharacterized protein (TIGR02996 family)
MQLDPDDLEGSLNTLLDEWRRTRAPEIADAIDRVSAVLTENEKPITAVGSKSAKAAWYETLAAKRPAAMERILEETPEATDRQLRLAALGEIPADPRIGTYARKWLGQSMVKAKNRAPFYSAVLRLIERQQDVRVAPAIDSLVKDRATAVRRCGLPVYKKLVATQAELAKTQPEPLDPATARALAAFKPAPPKKLGDPTALFATVYADPSDDSARAVLADLLTERGDPRGELIALQLARYGTDKRRSAQEKKLLDTWGRTWLGTIEPAVMKSGVEFERGFVAHVRTTKLASRVKGAIEWSTVTSVDASESSGYVGGGEFLVEPVMKNLRHVIGMSPTVSQLFAEKTMPWETVGFRVYRWEPERIPAAPFRAAKKLVLADAGNGLNVPAAAVASFLAGFPALETIDLDVDVELLPELRRFASVTLRSRDVIATRVGTHLTLDVLWSGGRIVRLIDTLKPARVLLTGRRVRDDAAILAAIARVGAVTEP